MNSGSRLDRLLKWRPTTGTDQAFAIYLYPVPDTTTPCLPFTDVRQSPLTPLTTAGEGCTWTMWRFWGLAHPQFLCVFATLQFTVSPLFISFLFSVFRFCRQCANSVFGSIRCKWRQIIFRFSIGAGSASAIARPLLLLLLLLWHIRLAAH